MQVLTEQISRTTGAFSQSGFAVACFGKYPIKTNSKVLLGFLGDAIDRYFKRHVEIGSRADKLHRKVT